ncbi:tyrosine-protein phosphatase [Streptomyces sp. NPDC047017]|uniref:tyrosine-protein phosphatase n=1 Tax=Streptomyces sp. NPDC047017 TaxID=3155024 RepID=UPI0033C2160B
MRASRLSRPAGLMLSLAALGCLPALPAPPADALPGARPPATAAYGTGSAGSVRSLALQGAVNVRDLGGYRTAGGGRVRYGQVFRADALSRLTDADVVELSRLGLRTVVDFRVPEEVRGDGADRLPAGLAVTSRPVHDLGLYTTTTEVIASEDPVAQRRTLGGGRAERLMRSVYRSFVTDPDDRRRFAETLRDIADRRETPLLLHCTSGKDRTGWLSYVLLRAGGVPAATAERDYLLSNGFRAAADRRTREQLGESGLMRDPDLLIPLQEVRAGYLEAALDQAGRDYGGLHGYLTRGLGLDNRTLAALRARLVG